MRGRSIGGPGKMLCERCGKKNASIHVTKIINGKKTEYYLCEDCAREKGEMEISLEGEFPLQHFFSGLMEFLPAGDSEAVAPKSYSGLQCPVCGLTYTQFGQVGRFGCARCYEAFEQSLSPLLRRLHGSQKHRGKIPVRAGSHVQLKREIEQLRQKLNEKVAAEAFEEAAVLRDRIREMESESADGGESHA